MKKIAIISLAALASASTAFAQDGACKGGITGFGGGLNIDVVGAGTGANCAFFGDSAATISTTNSSSGVFAGAFQTNTGSRQTFTVSGVSSDGGYMATLSQGTGTSIFDDSATGSFSNTSTNTTENLVVSAAAHVTGEGACKGGISASGNGLNLDVAGSGSAKCGVTSSKFDFSVEETSTTNVDFDDAAYSSGSGSIQTFKAGSGNETGGYSTSLVQGNGFQISGTANGNFSSTTTVHGRGWVMGTGTFN